MCGISGIVDFTKKTPLGILEKMNRMLQHRGPDGEGYSIFDTAEAMVGLGHRRLSIIDLTEGGKQPKTYEGLHITFNGEIYNYKEIKVELSAKGHIFDSNSDTEVVLHAYKEWGTQAIHKFTGMFAFVIYDENNKKIFACRDRAGVKPFFYYWHQGVFLFASELKAILQHPAFKKEINQNAAAIFIQHGYIPAPHCIFNNTYKLTQGHYLELVLSNSALNTRQYWNVNEYYNKPKLKIGLPEAIEETERILTRAFEYRMVSDVPVGVFLSGGYDSSCVTALLQKNSTEKIKTFTIGVADARLDEAPYAKKIAAHLGTEHTEYYCTEKEAIEIVPELAYYYDEPFADSSAIPTTLVSKIARQHVTVALSADAGDEIFAGYNRYDVIASYAKRMNQLPDFVKQGAAAVMNLMPANAIPYFNKKYLFEGKYEKLKSLLKDSSVKNIINNITLQVSDEKAAILFNHTVEKLHTAFDSEEINTEINDAISRVMAVDYETYMVDDILQKVDRATMSVSLEGREPFLDQSIIEYAAQLPVELKYNDGQKKILLKEIVHKYIPKHIMDRPKMGFVIPIRKWLQSDLKYLADKYLAEGFINKQGIFNNAEIQRIKNNFYITQTERVEKVWYLLMFQMWYDKWMNNN
jgi:asparagine synthase (glutamine-hydrolysing)